MLGLSEKEGRTFMNIIALFAAADFSFEEAQNVLNALKTWFTDNEQEEGKA